MVQRRKEFYLERADRASIILSDDSKRLLIEFCTDERGLSKTGVNGLIEPERADLGHAHNREEKRPLAGPPLCRTPWLSGYTPRPGTSQSSLRRSDRWRTAVKGRGCAKTRFRSVFGSTKT